MPETRVQLVLLKLPVLLVVNVTMPVGVPEEEVTVAVQVVGVLSGTLAGEHDNIVVVAPTVAVTVKAALVLPVCTVSPP